tara:strand:- start:75 stop:362 length:288 start_codon:yes stop_codon:yes gene_type:complete
MNLTTKRINKMELQDKWFDILNHIKIVGFTKTFAYNCKLVSIGYNDDNEKDEAYYYRIDLNADAKKVIELDPSVLSKLQEKFLEDEVIVILNNKG